MKVEAVGNVLLAKEYKVEEDIRGKIVIPDVVKDKKLKLYVIEGYGTTYEGELKIGDVVIADTEKAEKVTSAMIKGETYIVFPEESIAAKIGEK
ncbi:MAG TPA: hypothetical protein PLA71_00205 [Saccharofermentans sp.]|nr:hypothetical protein [Saccharofermentans sp.]